MSTHYLREVCQGTTTFPKLLKAIRPYRYTIVGVKEIESSGVKITMKLKFVDILIERYYNDLDTIKFQIYTKMKEEYEDRYEEIMQKLIEFRLQRKEAGEVVNAFFKEMTEEEFERYFELTEILVSRLEKEGCLPVTDKNKRKSSEEEDMKQIITSFIFGIRQD